MFKLLQKIGDKTKMEVKQKLEQLRQEWLNQPHLTDTLKEYLTEYFYDDYSYCEQCDKIASDSDWFWYEDEDYTDYLHIDCNEDKYLEQQKNLCKEETEENTKGENPD